MKRTFPQKVKPTSSRLSASGVEGELPRQAPQGVNRKARTSAAMLGLALSMGASGVVFPRHAEGATATEPVLSEATISEAANASPSAPELPSEPTQVTDSGTAESSAPLVMKHTVQPGQTLWRIAQAYQVSPEAVAQFNGISVETALRVGQSLRIPVSDQALTVPKQIAVAEQVASIAPSAPEALQSAQSELEERQAALTRMREERHALRDRLAALQNATTPVPQESVDKNQAEKPQAPTQAATVMPGATLYQVKPGDTLGAIASAHDVSARSLAMLNQLSDPDRLQVSQSLVVPPTAETQAPQVVASTLTDPTLQSAVTGIRRDPAAGVTETAVPDNVVQIHRIARGETVAQIARRYNVPSSTLIAANRLNNPNLIRVGATLRIPATEGRVVPGALVSSGAPIDQQPASQTVAALPPSTVETGSMPSGAIADAGADSERASNGALFSTDFVGADEAPATVSSTVPPTAQETAITEDRGLSNLYVSRLVSEMSEVGDRAIRNQPTESPVAEGDRPESEPSVEQAGVEQPTLVSAATLSTSAPALEDESRLNPELRAAVGGESERVQSPAFERRQSSTQNPAPAESPQQVAVGPLGSEEYAPLRQPLVGRMVSPELPPLPGADAFLPSGSSAFAGYAWPARGVLTSGYGWRWGRMHRGVDIAAPVGTPIYAAAPGVVQFSGWNSGGYGNMVEIRHSDGSMTRYAHNSRNLVRVGQQVEQGQQIAAIGSTGYSTGPHVHFEVHLPNQGTVNPVAMLPRR